MQKILTCLAFFLLAAVAVAQTNSPIVQFGERHTIHSKILNEDRPYWVYLPPSYKPNLDHSALKYPVLYLLDGEWNFEWACEVAHFMGDTLEIPELIVVGVPNTDRARDLTPTHVTDVVSSGGGPAFERFLSVELAPEIDAQWQTAPYRMLFGHSWGGALAMDLFLRQTNGFQGYIAVDPSLWWDHGILVDRAKKYSPKTNSHDAVFIAPANWPHNFYGETNSNKHASDLFLSALNTNSSSGIRVGYRFLDSEDHGSSRLLALYNGLRFIFQDYKPANFYALDTPALLEDHFKKVSERLGFQIPPPEGYVNKIGDALLSPAHAKKAIECFKLNVTNYPAAAAVYSHLAAAYLANGETNSAIQNYRKALQLNPNMDSAKQALQKLK